MAPVRSPWLAARRTYPRGARGTVNTRMLSVATYRKIMEIFVKVRLLFLDTVK
jgi:hypothetical protein